MEDKEEPEEKEEQEALRVVMSFFNVFISISAHGSRGGLYGSG